MKTHLISPNELSKENLRQWSVMQQGNPTFDSPFFCPEYTLAVSKKCSDVEIAILEADQEVAGFFPFHRNKGNIGIPVGRNLTDFQGIISHTELNLEPKELIRACRLKAWHFNHLVSFSKEFQNYSWAECESPYIDLHYGLAHYLAERQKSSRTVAETYRKKRKLEREVGPLRFVPFTRELEILDQILRWKKEQYIRIKSIDHLSSPWAGPFLKDIAQTQTDNFSGMVSALYCGEELIAAHLGMLSNGVLHCWFPVYNNDYAKYSPGLIFWLSLLEHAENLQLKRLDFGKGSERYKQSWKNGASRIAIGSIDCRPISGKMQRFWFETTQGIRRSPLNQPAKWLVRSFRNVFRQVRSYL